MRVRALATAAAAWLGIVAASDCGGPELTAGEPPPVDDLAVAEQAWVSCEQWTDTGYVDGSPFLITLVTADDRPVEVNTANAYAVMQEAAASDGVDIRIVSGFRTWAEQDYLYDCYQCCCCNNCNLAAPPGYSNHQSGHALDLNTSSSGVLSWLNAHGAAYGFERTVPSENWHWEWWGGGPGGGPCDATSINTCTVTETGETGECMGTDLCAELGGDHVSTPGYCPGPSDIQCCTGTTPCTVPETGETGECLSTAACEALGEGYVSTAGLCPGPSTYQCCTGPPQQPDEDAGVPDGNLDPDAAPDADVPDDAGADAGTGAGWPAEQDPGGIPGGSGSCGCRLAGARPGTTSSASLLVVLLGLLGARRRRAARSHHGSCSPRQGGSVPCTYR